MNVLLNRINAPEMANIQGVQYQECLYVADTVLAGARQLGQVQVSNIGPFFLRHITISYTTVDNVAAVATDTGIDYLRAQLIDGSNNRPLFNDFIPLGLWSTPGRRRSLTGAVAGGESFQMQIIFPFEYLFPINSSIQLDVINDAVAVANSYSAAFWGIRVRSARTNAQM